MYEEAEATQAEIDYLAKELITLSQEHEIIPDGPYLVLSSRVLELDPDHGLERWEASFYSQAEAMGYDC